MTTRKTNPIRLTGGFSWLPGSGLIDSHGESVKLGKSEFRALQLLFSNINIPVEVRTIHEELFWEDDRELNNGTIRNIISALRKKLPEGIIENIYGSAYIVRSSAIEGSHRHETGTVIDRLEGFWRDIIDQANNGIVITDPRQKGHPVVFCNRSFLKVFHYSEAEVLGKNLRFLRGGDTQEEASEKIREAMRQQVPVTVRLRNYTKYGDLVPIELTVSPIFERNSGRLQFYLGIQKTLEAAQVGAEGASEPRDMRSKRFDVAIR